MKKTIFQLFIFICITLNFVDAQEVKTMTYFQNDTIALDLDLYLPQKKQIKKQSLKKNLPKNLKKM